MGKAQNEAWIGSCNIHVRIKGVGRDDIGTIAIANAM